MALYELVLLFAARQIGS